MRFGRQAQERARTPRGRRASRSCGCRRTPVGEEHALLGEREPDRQARGAGPSVDVVLAHVGAQADRRRPAGGGAGRGRCGRAAARTTRRSSTRPAASTPGTSTWTRSSSPRSRPCGVTLDPRADRVVDDARRSVVDEREERGQRAAGSSRASSGRRSAAATSSGSASEPPGAARRRVRDLGVELVVGGCRDRVRLRRRARGGRGIDAAQHRVPVDQHDGGRRRPTSSSRARG